MTNSKNINQETVSQEGSIVSKEIISKPTGSVTLFAFSKGQSLSEHTVPYDALVIATEGSAEITVSGQRYEAKAGEMLLMPANEPHALKAVQAFKMLLVMIKS